MLAITEKFRTRKARTSAKLVSTFRDGRQEFSLGSYRWFAKSDLVNEPHENHDVAFIGAALIAMSNNIEFECDLPVTKGCVAAVDRLWYALRHWQPRKIYFPRFRATNIVDNVQSRNDSCALCISGGLDSTFSAYMNSIDRRCDYGVLTIGGDFEDLNDPRYGLLRERAKAICERFGLEYAEVEYSTAFRKSVNWKMFHIATLWMLQRYLQPTISRGAVSADQTPVSEFAHFPWGNCGAIVTALDDPSFPYFHIGRDFERFKKMETLVHEAPDIISSIIVCDKPTLDGKNCGTCKKCIRTQLNLAASGRPMPELFLEHPDLGAWLKKQRPYRPQLSIRRELGRALEHVSNLPEGELQESAEVYCQNIERALIPRGRI